MKNKRRHQPAAKPLSATQLQLARLRAAHTPAPAKTRWLAEAYNFHNADERQTLTIWAASEAEARRLGALSAVREGLLPELLDLRPAPSKLCS
jgi:hypothetical protein